MIKYFKEMRELKKARLTYQVLILNKINNFVNSITDITDIASKLKDVDSKDLVSELVKVIKANEVSEE